MLTFQTEYEGQIKQFMTVFESKDADGIAVAGGNGSVLEVCYSFFLNYFAMIFSRK